eukprot:TRINITY_DN352_c0_g2_i4.p1 TRINITY_DN352_c0_g2~~TRINITY_DN352_c0_g2_i4.p1  ORF type:complete len:615 (+),score=88.33 TRINITY_DN352_c0_g2_i4:50-1894(+)
MKVHALLLVAVLCSVFVSAELNGLDIPDLGEFKFADLFSQNLVGARKSESEQRRYHNSPLPTEFRDYLHSNKREEFCHPVLNFFTEPSELGTIGGKFAKHVDLLDQRTDDFLDHSYFGSNILYSVDFPIYMLSSEIRESHRDLYFGSLPSSPITQFNFIPEDHQPVEGDSARLPENDFPGNKPACPKGPGTALATLLRAHRYGLTTPETNLINYIVEDNYGHGSLAWVIAALEAIIERHSSEILPGVLLLPYSFPPNEELDCLMEKLVKVGIVPVVPAGDHNTDACKRSPARSPYAFTIGAIRHDKFEKASFSNYGSCVDLYVPGTGISAASWRSDEQIDFDLEGINYAAAIGAGAVSYYIQLARFLLADNDPQMTWLDVVRRLSSLTATKVPLGKSDVPDDIFFSMLVTFAQRTDEVACINLHDPSVWKPCEVCNCFDGKVEGIGPQYPEFQPVVAPGCAGFPSDIDSEPLVRTTFRVWLRGERGDFDLHLFENVPSLIDSTEVQYGEKPNYPEPVYDPHDELPDPSPLPPTPLYAPVCVLDNAEKNKETVENWKAVASSCSPGASEYLEFTPSESGVSFLSIYVDANDDAKGAYSTCVAFKIPADFLTQHPS